MKLDAMRDYYPAPYSRGSFEHSEFVKIYDVMEKSGKLNLPETGYWVFFSPSASSGEWEKGIAKAIDKKVIPTSCTPLFVLGDINLYTNKKSLLPLESPLKKVKLAKLVSDAQSIPLPDGSVDILFDRLGAMWHCCTEVLEPDRPVFNIPPQKLLLEYLRVLKPSGSIIFDAYYRNDVFNGPVIGPAESTWEMLRKLNMNYSELGVETNFIGENESRLCVITKQTRGEVIL